MLKSGFHDSGHWRPSLFVFDTEACTKEDDDLINGILYHYPQSIPTALRIALYGQVAGVIHFCKSNFTIPSIIETKGAQLSIKDYGRFLFIVCGLSVDWVTSVQDVIGVLLDSSTGGLPNLWVECDEKIELFQEYLTQTLDSIALDVFSESQVDSLLDASSSATTSPVCIEVSPLSEHCDSNEAVGLSKHDGGEDDTLSNYEFAFEKSDSLDQRKILLVDHRSSLFLHRDLSAVPSVPLPKSDGGVFLRAQQLLEVCKLQHGVLSGAVLFDKKILASQVDDQTGFVLTSINFESKEHNILQEVETSFFSAQGTTAHILYMPKNIVSKFKKSSPERFVKRSEKKSLQNEASSVSLSSLRNALQNRPLHSYPSSVPSKQHCEANSESEVIPEVTTASVDPTLPQPSAILNFKNEFLNESRPSQSLPNTPRKIQVSTMLPDVGRDSPDLRYKVLTARRPKPLNSSQNTPKRMPGGVRNGSFSRYGKALNDINNRIGLCAPLLKKNDYWTANDKVASNIICHPALQTDKENINNLDSTLNNTDGINLSFKNHKNKLILPFAPDKIYRPNDDAFADLNIPLEINGNKESNIITETLNSNLNSVKSKIIDVKDDDEWSKSEESEISILELNNFMETKANGNAIFEMATRNDYSRHDWPISSQRILSSSNSEGTSGSVGHALDKEDEWVRVLLLIMKHSNLTLCLILERCTGAEKETLNNLVKLSQSKLPDIEKSILKVLDVSEEKEGDTFIQNSNSVLSGIDLQAMNIKLLLQAHKGFKKHPSLTEITFRDGESIVWGHRNFTTETFYQSVGVHRPGLPISSDVMARIQHRARRRLERDYGITIM